MSERSPDHPVDRLSPYLDGALSGEERERVARHLETCASCRDHLASLRALAAALAAEAPPPVPEGLAARVSAAVAGAKVVPMRRRLAVPVTIAATVAAAGLLVAYWWHETAPTIPPPSGLAASGREPAASAPVWESAGSEAAESERAQATKRLKSPGYVGGTAKEASAPPKPLSGDVANTSVERRALAHELFLKKKIAAGELRRSSASSTAPPAGISDEPSAAAPLAPLARSSASAAKYVPAPCTGLKKVVEPVATWDVGDMQVALRELASVAAGAGGHGDKTPVATGQPYEITVPKERFEDLRKRLEARGVANLPRKAPAAPDASCLLVRVSIRVVLGAP